MEDIQYNKTFIIGAGGLGRELYSWINSSNKEASNYNITGFLDDIHDALKNYEIDARIVGNIDVSKFEDDSRYLIAITDCNNKETLYKDLIQNQAQILDYKHSSVKIGARTILGLGTVLSPNVIISCDAKIGNLVFVNCGSQIGHDVTVDDYSSIMASVNIGGGASIGKRVLIGTGAVILPGVKIPDDTVVGAGAVVIRSIKKSGTYFGNPAKKIF